MKNKTKDNNLVHRCTKAIGIIVMILTITCIVEYFRKAEISVDEQKINFGLKRIMENTETLQKNEEIGKNAYISSSQVVKRTTGIGPFDEETEKNSSNNDGTVTWTAGDDTSEADEIVRSFDQITWTIENTMSLKEHATNENYTGGTIEVKAILPENCANLVKWDKDSMNWAENATISNDGRIFTAQYTMTNTEITAPGKQTLVFILKVLGASNGQEISPTFSFKLYGNEDEDTIEITDEKIYVSAAPNYNISLVKNENLTKKVTVDVDGDGQEETEGRMYGYGVILQLYNSNSSKGLKGIEYPKGDITFDINMTLERTLAGSNTTEDITDLCTPILWNYHINQTTAKGNIAGRTMDFGNSYTQYINKAPYGIKLNNRTTSVYNSGKISMKQNGNTINTTISGYDFDGEFPMYIYNYGTASHTTINYTENIGCFSVGYFQVLVPYNEESKLEDRSYYFTVEDTNFKATSNSGVETTTQMLSSDDSIKTQHVIYKNGSYSHSFYLSDGTTYKFMSSIIEAGDSYGYRGQTIRLQSKFIMSINNDDDIYTANKFLKFDGDCVEPILNSEGEKYNTTYFDGTMKFNVWYVTKKDGTNWQNYDEMINANIENMDIWENIEDIPEGYICIGEYLESDDTYGNLAASSGNNNVVSIALKIKETAEIGKTYAFTGRTQYWIDALDRNVYTIKNNGNFTYPASTWDSGNRKYVKTEYDENGKQIEGTHYNGVSWGQSLLIVGGELGVNKKEIDENGNEKKNYDFSKNEYNVTYKIQPTVKSLSNIKDVTLEITDTLPKGMTYVRGSSNLDEPEVIYNDEDGTTTLKWHVYGVETQKAIQPITYQAHIDETTKNGENLESTVVITEVPNTDGDGNKIYKLGNTEIANRTYKTSIQVINLSSYSLYKTTETPIVEVNGTIHYKITLINKTDDSTSDFKLLDILPYNGDNRGTSYNGTYEVEKIDITETNTLTGKTINNDNLKLYVTSNENVRNQATAKDEDLGLTSAWSQSTSGENINNQLTAYALIGEIEAREKLEIDIYLKPDGNKPCDIYRNLATAQTNSNSEVIETSIITVQVVKRMLNGYVWFDSNKDGVISEGEKYLSGVKVTLLKEDGTEALDVNENKIAPVETDDNGYYNFENMQKGKYIVKVEVTDTEKEITAKKVGTNVEINSKFNQDETTDVIQSLNNSESPILKESYVNAGIAYKDTSVLVHHYIEKTTTKVSNDVTINGKIHDLYTTSKASDIASKYELVSMPENSTGVMTQEPIEVIYYYRIKSANLESKIEKTATEKITSKDANVYYEIKFTSEVKNLEGKAEVTIVDTLPYPINKEKSDLAGGTYSEKEKTITWIEEINNINTYTTGETKQISITKSISLNYKYGNIDDIPQNMENKVESTIKLQVPDDENPNEYKILTEEKQQDTAKTQIEIPAKIIVHNYIYDEETKQYTTIKITDDECGEGIIGQEYTTEKTDKAPNYICINETPEKYKGKLTEETIEVIYYYKLKPSTIESQITKTVTVNKTVEKKENVTNESTQEETKQVLTQKNGQVKYQISYKTTIKDYIGKAEITIMDTLPSAIDATKSDLNGGTYNEKDKTIIWKEEVDINTYENGAYEYNKTKEISVVYKEQNLNEDLVNEAIGKTTIYYPENHSTKPGKEMDNKEVKDTATIEQEYIKEISVKKVWDDNENNKGKRPESVTIQLTANGKNVENSEAILSENNKWTYTYKNLPMYTDKGEEIQYSVQEKETKEKDLEYYEEPTINGTENIIITNKYKLMNTNLDSEITKEGSEIITSTKDAIEYKINYKATIEDYIGEAIVTIVDTLPYKIDEEKSDLNGGTYNEETKTITWKEKIEHINTEENGNYKIDIQKDIKIVYTDIDVLKDSMTNHVKGTIDLYETEKSNTVEDDFETKTDIKGTVNTKYIDKDTGEEIVKGNTITDRVGKDYNTEKKEIENYDFVEVNGTKEGKIAEKTTEVIYYYTKTPAEVIVKYVDEEGNEIEKQEIVSGHVGEKYETEEKKFDEYELIKKPENSKGSMTKDTITVTYIYKRVKTKVTIKYLEKETNKELAEITTIEGFVGEKYNAERKTITNYQKAEPEPENSSGKMTKDIITVTYYYEKIPGGIVSVKYMDIDTKEEIVQGYTIQGYVGDGYETKEKEIPYYNILQKNLPSNSKGNLTQLNETVIYYYKKVPFNMSINKTIEEVVYNGKNISIKNGKTSKIDIAAKEVQNANIRVKYGITITNTEELAGTAQVIDKIPQHFKVSQENPDYWSVDKDGNLVFTTKELKAGESVKLEVILDWVNGESNFGEEKNVASIISTKNEANYEEVNKNDNNSEATIMIGLQTGLDNPAIYLISEILLISGLTLIAYLNLRLKFNKSIRKK